MRCWDPGVDLATRSGEKRSAERDNICDHDIPIDMRFHQPPQRIPVCELEHKHWRWPSAARHKVVNCGLIVVVDDGRGARRNHDGSASRRVMVSRPGASGLGAT